MPTYDYRCAACGHELEVFQTITEAPKKKCPACGKRKLERQISGGAAFLFKGSGFYVTDYRSDAYKKAVDAESKGSSAGSSETTAPPAAGKAAAGKAAEDKPAEDKKRAKKPGADGPKKD